MFRGAAGAKRDGARSKPLSDRGSSLFDSAGARDEDDDWMTTDAEDARRGASSSLSRLRPAKRSTEAIAEGGSKEKIEAVISHSVLQCPECTIVVQRGDTTCFMCGSALSALGGSSPARPHHPASLTSVSSSSSNEWACSRCTYYNAQGARSCEMCGSLRQEEFSMPSSSKATLSTAQQPTRALEASSTSSRHIDDGSKDAGPGKILSRLRRLNETIDVPSASSLSRSSTTTTAAAAAADIYHHGLSGEPRSQINSYKTSIPNEVPSRVSSGRGLAPEVPARSQPTSAPLLPATRHPFSSASHMMKSAGSDSSSSHTCAAQLGIRDDDGFSDGSFVEDAGTLSSNSSSSHGSYADDLSASEDDDNSGAFIEAANDFEDDIEDVSSDEAMGVRADDLWGGGAGQLLPSKTTYTVQHTNGRADYIIKSSLADECPELSHFVSVRELMSIKGSTQLDFNVFSLSHASATTRRNYDKRRAVNERPAAKRKRPSKRAFKQKKS